MKILESMALERPVVSSALGCEGLPVEDGKNILVADRPERFADKLVEVIGDPALSKLLTGNARRLVESGFGWSELSRRLMEAYDRVLASTTPRT